MAVKAGRRKVRKRKAAGEKYGMKLKAFVVIIVLAVFLGFLTARFVIGPIIGYNADESPISPAEEPDASEVKYEQEQDGDLTAFSDKGYALQFGAFSTREAAQKLSDMLSEKGIITQIVETDQVFKVMGRADESKDNILEDLKDAKEKDIEDVFVTSLG